MTTSYVLIASSTASTTVTSVAFNSIPSTYTDLKLVFSGRSTGTGGNQYEIIGVRMNAVTANYSNRVLDNYNGISSYTNFNGITDGFILGVVPRNDATASTFSNGEIYFGNYSSASYQKLGFTNSVASQMTSTLNNYDLNLAASKQTSTAAITDITIYGISWTAGSTVYLYGLQKA